MAHGVERSRRTRGRAPLLDRSGRVIWTGVTHSGTAFPFPEREDLAVLFVQGRYVGSVEQRVADVDSAFSFYNTL